MNKNFEIWINKQIEYYRPFLGITLNQIKIMYDDSVNYFSISLSYPYLNPTIYYGDSAIESFKNGRLNKRIVLHELCHIITDPLYVKATQRYASEEEVEGERERLTDLIGNIVTNLLEKK